MVPQDTELEDGPKLLRELGGVAVGLPANDEAHEAGQPVLGRGPGQVLQRLGTPPRPRKEPAAQLQAHEDYAQAHRGRFQAEIIWHVPRLGDRRLGACSYSPKKHHLWRSRLS